MDDAAQQIEFVACHRQRLRAGGRLVSGLCNVRRVCRRALQRGFRGREAERHGCNSAGRDADELDRAGRDHGADANFDQRPLRTAAADRALVERAFTPYRG